MAYIDNVTNILQIQPDGLPTFVRLSQNENGRNLYFQLAGNEIDIPANATITISGTKPDGTVYSGTGSISDNVILIPEMIQMTAVAGYWDAKVKIISGGNTIATGRIRFVIDADTVDPDSVPSDSELEGLVAEAQQYAETARTEAYGSPLTAQTVAGMTDHTRVYVYTGSESGYTAGHWYFWNGSAWTDGGIYNSTATNTDPTLTLAGVPADAKATGDKLTGLKEDLSQISEDMPNIGYVTDFTGSQSISGVSISRKSACQLNVWGTADGWAKFNVLRGNNEITQGTPTYTVNLPAGTYTLVKSSELAVFVDSNTSASWKTGETKTFTSDVCIWLRVTSSSQSFGTADNPTVFEFAIYEGETDYDTITASGLTAVDQIARMDIDGLKNATANMGVMVTAEPDTARPYNLIPPDCVFTLNSYIKNDTGEVTASQAGRVATGYIEIDPIQEYLCHVLKVRIVGASGIRDGNIPIDDDVKSYFAFYDKDKKFIAYTGTATDISKAIPSKAKYFRFTLNASNLIPFAMLTYGNYNSIPSFAYAPYRHDIEQIQTYSATGYENIKMVMFGDSITHGDLGLGNDGISYVNYANDFLRGNIINVGLGGSRLSQGNPTGVGLGSFASLCENIVSTDADAWDALDAYVTNTQNDWGVHVAKLKSIDWSTVQAIGLLYGANDYNNNVPVGTEYNEDPTKYDGACAYGLDLLLTKYPHLQVILFTPFYRKIDSTHDSDMENTAGLTMDDYGASLKNVQTVFHCPVVDSGNEIGISKYTIYTYSPSNDGTHPRTNIGQYRLGRFFAEAIKRYIQPF